VRLRLAIGTAGVVTVLATIGTTVTTLAVTDASAAETPTATVREVTTAATTWSAPFDGFPGAAWKSAWGVVGSGQFGFDRMFAMTGGGLLVRYGAGSSAPSCTNCPSAGGGQFYTALGASPMATSRTLSLKYQLKFPVGHDFGRGGKLPGLYGGNPGEAAGGNHGNAWSTRFMWRNGNQGSNMGEVYFYSPDEEGYGRDLGLGAWRYPADDQYHTIEQFVDRTRQTITVWLDGRQVFTTTVSGISAIDFGGIFFSTFYGGHSTEWGPAVSSEARFKNFSLSTAIQH
jgi:hypothetical protein